MNCPAPPGTHESWHCDVILSSGSLTGLICSIVIRTLLGVDPVAIWVS